jgi:hypothetical protein
MTIQVPTDLNDITVDQYQRYMAANVEGAEEDFLMFKTIEIFCDVDMKAVSQFPLSQAQDLYRDIILALDQTPTFRPFFTHDGVDYGFMPDMESMSIGEYIDLESGLSDSKDLHKAAAVMFRPIKKRKGNYYTIADYKASNEEGKNARSFPMGVVSSAVVFFYSIAKELLLVSRHYSRIEQIEKDSKTIALELSLLRNGAGISPSTH